MNGTKSSPVTQRVIELLENHVELGTLEYRYESSQARRRICAVILGAVFGLTAFVFVQIALVLGFLRLGLPLWELSLVAASIYAILSVLIYQRWGRRDPEAGPPFQTSTEELKRSFQWIRKNLS